MHTIQFSRARACMCVCERERERERERELTKYEYFSEPGLKFCSASNVSGHEVHLLFENTSKLNATGSSKKCWCKIRSSGNFTLKSRDLRFQNATGHCTGSNSLTSTAFGNITCSQNRDINASLLGQPVEVSDHSEFELSFDPRNKPQMVWIEAEGI